YSSAIFFEFFFSSRRRHTRSKRDWSSDVCSSDLFALFAPEDAVLRQMPAAYFALFAGYFCLAVSRWHVDELQHSLNREYSTTDLNGEPTTKIDYNHVATVADDATAPELTIPADLTDVYSLLLSPPITIIWLNCDPTNNLAEI